MGGDAGQRARELLREIARANEMAIYAGAINRDHVHMLISIPPQMSVSRAVQFLKRKSSHKLLKEFSPCESGIGVSTYGHGDIGSLQAGM